ncbi:hypothetical protein BHS07_36155 [Myxococcus xanthus]|nr:hypothetical protein BHS07_36155 [Myxococcus xanthus]
MNGRAGIQVGSAEAQVRPTAAIQASEGGGALFWRALRRLEGEFAANGATLWRFEFPHRAVSRLGDALRQ